MIGKGVIRFHAVYWPAILLSAGLRLPSELLVHGYVTIDGQKISKSLRNTVSPAEGCAPYGADALRYYLLRHIGSRRDGDFSWARFAEVYAHELANAFGNLVSRTIALGRRYGVPDAAPSELAASLGGAVQRHIEDFALDRALDAIWEVVGAVNAYVNRTEPWRLAQRGETPELAARARRAVRGARRNRERARAVSAGDGAAVGGGARNLDGRAAVSAPTIEM